MDATNRIIQVTYVEKQKVRIKVLWYQTTILNVFERSTVETVNETFSCDDKNLLHKGLTYFFRITGIVNKGDL